MSRDRLRDEREHSTAQWGGGTPPALDKRSINGLDPTGIADVRTLIKEISESGKTIILASHLLDEVEKVCTHVAILKKGQLLASGPMDELLQGDKVIEVQAPDMKALKEALQAHEPSLTLIEHGECLQVSGKNLQPSELNRYCFDQGISFTGLLPVSLC